MSMVVLRVLTPSSLSKTGDGEGLTQGGVIAVAILDSFLVLLCAAQDPSMGCNIDSQGDIHLSKKGSRRGSSDSCL